LATYEVFSAAERDEIRAVLFEPDISPPALERHYLLGKEELALIRRHKGSANRLGFAVQLCYLRYPGRAWERGESVSAVLVEYLAEQLEVNSKAFVKYAERPATRREHLTELYLTEFNEDEGLAVIEWDENRELQLPQFEIPITLDGNRNNTRLGKWLLPMVLETENVRTLFTVLVEECRRRQIVLPAFYRLERLVWQVRRTARLQIWQILAGDLTTGQKKWSDDLLKGSGSRDKRTSDLVWLRRPHGYMYCSKSASPPTILNNS
jgi:hypothetical protein